MRLTPAGLAQGSWAIAATLAAPALRLMLHRRLASGREIAGRLAERTGQDTTKRPAGRLLWLHAASVGESLSVLPLLAALPEEITTLFTTGTASSARLLGQRLPPMGLDGRVLHRFVPLDVPAWVARFLDHWRPDAACFVESELWPNSLAACRKRRIPTALVNARLSARSARAWSRLPGFARHLLGGFDLVTAQSEADAARLRSLGAARAVCWGNLKTEAGPLPADRAAVAELAARLGEAPRWLAASTHPEDDAIILAAHAALCRRHPGLLTAIAPRHPPHGQALAARSGAALRSAGAPPPADGGIWVADTLGELGLLYRCFPIVLMGKSFGQGGGQNPWEPACLGCAVAIGPAHDNFAETVATLSGAGALATLGDADALAPWLDHMLADRAARVATGEAALAATSARGDLAERHAMAIAALMGAG